MKKALIVASICAFSVSHAFGIENAATSADTGSTENILMQIENLDDEIDRISTLITRIEGCGDSGQIYGIDASGLDSCVSINELDPNLEIHAQRPMATSCTGKTESAYYNGSSWVCKTLNNP